MPEIKASDVAALRAKTGCGMMDCKNALVAANGDLEEAMKCLRERGLAVAAKKADRIAAEGIIDIAVVGNTAVIIEVNTETDFVAKNEAFRAFVRNILATIIKNKPANVEELLACKYIDSDKSVADELVEQVFKIGEKINIRRFIIVEGIFSTYIHGGGVAGVIASFDTTPEVATKDEFKEMSKNVCLQIASGYNAQYVSRADVPANVVNAEREIILAQIANDPENSKKPQNILEKMADGRLGKFFQSICLTEQEYIKDSNLTTGKYVDSVVKAIGTPIAIKSFILYEKGEGLAKREDNFADEIEKLTK